MIGNKMSMEALINNLHIAPELVKKSAIFSQCETVILEGFA